jgi:hypothetical protein
VNLKKCFPLSNLPACLGGVLCLLAGAVAAQPAASLTQDLRFSGFGTIGVARIEAPEGWAYGREASQPQNVNPNRADLDTRLGLQLNYAPSPSFEIVGQAILTRRPDSASDSNAVEWGFAAYRPSPEWTLRLGRVNLDSFTLSDHRNVGFAYAFARPPIEFYAQLPSTLDGADIERVWNRDGAHWRTKAFYGRSKIAYDDPNRAATFRDSFGWFISREADGLTLRLNVSQARVGIAVPAEARPLFDGLRGLSELPLADVAAQASALLQRLSVDGIKHSYVSLGIQYEIGHWLLAGELMRVRGSPSSSFSAGYASVARRFDAVTVYTVASRIASSTPAVVAPDWAVPLTPVIGPAAAQQAQFLGSTAATLANNFRAQQDTLSLGARVDLGPQTALKVQWDRIRVAPNGSVLWGNASAQPARARMTSVSLDFIF